LNNKEFRQALAYALDREELVAKAVRGFGLAGHPWLYTPDSFWYNPNVEQYEYDPQKTAEILTKLGYQRDPSTESAYWFKDNKQLQLGLLCDANLIRAAEIIKEQLAKVGIAIEIKSVETQSRDARILAWDFDLALNSHGGLGGDPELLNRFFLDEAFNSARFQANRELVSLIQQQATIMEEEARKELVDEIQTILAEEVAALTLYYPQAFWAHNGQVPLFYTKGGIAGGIPLPLNKLSFIES
jgi:peptide/nickel transport system substrate-binding protein